jgi:segregation and condensation protein A
MAEFEPTDDGREDPASDAQVPFDGIVEGSLAATGAEPDADAVEDGHTLVRRPVYRVQIEAFEGPLDLLLHLIREHEIDIYDIPIAEITQQYLEYLEFMETLDLELAGEFLEMAATLIRIKVRMLLPPPIEEGEAEEDPREQLVRKLVEYRKFKEAARELGGREEERRGFFQHGVDMRAYRDLAEEELDTEEFLRDVTLFDLVDGLREVLSRVPHRIDVHAVDMEQVTVEEEMDRLGTILGDMGSIQFAQLFAESVSRIQIITTFIALLELIRLGVVMVVQERTFGEILVSLKTEGEH